MKTKSSLDHKLRCLHLGDSYTTGEGLSSEEAWPAQLKSLLENAGTSIECVKTLARTGWTTADLLSAMDSSNFKAEWDVVTLCIGVNNQYQGLDPAHYEIELNRLVEKAEALLEFPFGKLILLSIPDWSVSPFAERRDRANVAKQIDTFNERARSVAQKAALPFIDWTPLSRSYHKQAHGFTQDGLHPSAEQHRCWAEFLFNHWHNLERKTN